MKRAALLDIDGTLVDSNDLHARSWQETFARFDIEVGFEKLRGLIGMGGEKLLPAAANIEKESDLGERLSQARSELWKREYLPKVHPIAGARAFIERLQENGVLPVVATSAKGDELEGLLERGQVLDLLPLRTGADDVEHSKPDPDIVQAALRLSQVGASEAVMIGDTPYDLEAAKGAGVDFIAVRSGGYEDNDFEGAVAVYRDVGELCERFDSSVFARGRR